MISQFLYEMKKVKGTLIPEAIAYHYVPKLAGSLLVE